MLMTMLTTIDNPFDPFTQWDDWFAFDTRHGYNSSSFLARIVVTSDELSEPDQRLAIENAVDEIVKENVLGKWRKVTKEVPDDAQDLID